MARIEITPEHQHLKGKRPSKSILFKGRPGLLELHLDQDAPLQTILQDLEKTLAKNATSLGNPSIRLHFGQRPLDPLQIHEIRRVLMQYNLKIEQIKVNPEAVEEFLEDKCGIPISIQIASKYRGFKDKNTPTDSLKQEHAQTPFSNSNAHQTPKTQFSAYEQTIHMNKNQMLMSQSTSFPSDQPQKTANKDQTEPRVKNYSSLKHPYRSVSTMYNKSKQIPNDSSKRLSLTSCNKKMFKILKTCRAGTFLEFDGNVVIFGDINSGAEIRATGDIIVFGALRGIAHAGYKGDQKAIITAFSFHPTQLRLGDQIAISPPNQEPRTRPQFSTEIAYLNKNFKIEVEKYRGRIPNVIQERITVS